MSWSVGGTKKGGWPLTVEKRKSHKVTVIRNVRGDPGALVTELKNALGAGGVAREGCIEIQGDHEGRVRKFLVESGKAKGISGLGPKKEEARKGGKLGGSQGGQQGERQGQEQPDVKASHGTTPSNGGHRIAVAEGSHSSAVLRQCSKRITALLAHRRGSGPGAAFHRYVSLMKTWVYWDHDYGRLEELWEAFRTGDGPTLRGAAFMEDTPSESSATTRKAAPSLASVSDDKLRELGMLAAPSSYRESRVERQRHRKTVVPQQRGPHMTAKPLSTSTGGAYELYANGNKQHNQHGQHDSTVYAPATSGVPPKPYTAAWYAGLAAGKDLPSTSNCAQGPLYQRSQRPQQRVTTGGARGRGGRGKYGSSRRNAAETGGARVVGGSRRRAAGGGGGGGATPHVWRASPAAYDSSGEEVDTNDVEYYWSGEEDAELYLSDDATRNHQHCPHGPSLSGLVEEAFGKASRRLEKAPLVHKRGHNLPHVDCSDLWGELDEEAAFQLAMRLSLVETHEVTDATAEDTATRQEELELEEALARSMADTSAHSESSATQDNPQAAMLNYRALAQRTGSSSDCEQGRDCSGSSWFGSSNWWMSSSGRGASGEGTQEAARSGRGLREAPVAEAAAPDSLFPDLGSNVQGDMSDEQALELALQLSAANANDDEREAHKLTRAVDKRGQPSAKEGVMEERDVLSCLYSSLAVIIGDEDRDNLEVVMEFLQGIGSAQGVQEYLEEVLLERSGEDRKTCLELAWAEVEPFVQGFAGLYGW